MCLFKKDIYYKTKQGDIGYASVVCGHCVECLQAQSFEWANRCLMEASLHEKNMFLTLTYNNDFVHFGLKREVIQKFIKRLRYYFSCKSIRYFGCAEYGTNKSRPHFHLIIFGACFDDLEFFKRDGKGSMLFRSFALEKLWPYGFSTVGEVNFESAKYCSKYMQKLTRFSSFELKPYTFMSLKPSIGINYVSDDDLKRGYCYLFGKKVFLPRSFYKSFERKGILFPEAKEYRMLHSFIHDSLLLPSTRLSLAQHKDYLIYK